MDKYAEWIQQRIDRAYEGQPWRTAGACRYEAQLMEDEFPELEVVRGYVMAWFGNVGPTKRGHWWCVDPDGTIVDPTVGQFSRVGSYEEWKEGDEVRLGTCMECGAEIWGVPGERDSSCCSDRCERALIAELG